MTHQSNVSSILHHRRLLRSLGWLSSMGLLGSGVAFAQMAPDAPMEVPAAQDLLQVEPAAPPAPRVDAPRPVGEPAAPQRPEPVRRERPAAEPVRTEPAPAPPATPEAPSRVNLEQVTDNARKVVQSEQFIDTSEDYNLGATGGDRPSVVFSERSTGCKAVLQPGQGVPSGLCGRSGGTAQGRRAIVAGQVAEPERSLPGGRQGRRMAGSRSVTVGPIRLGAAGVDIPLNFYNPLAQPVGVPGNGNTRLLYPLSIPAPITSAFGWRIHPITGVPRFHYGTDLGAPMGTPVLAAFSGQVGTAEFLRGYGLTVILHHNRRTQETLYAHLSEIFVRPGEWVEQGQAIGRVGSTGNSTGPHLHFEKRQLTEQGWAVLDAGNLLTNALGQITETIAVARLSPRAETAQFSLSFAGLREVSSPFPMLSVPVTPKKIAVKSWLPTISEQSKDWDKADLKLNKSVQLKGRLKLTKSAERKAIAKQQQTPSSSR